LGAIISQARLVYHEQTNKRIEIEQRNVVCLLRATSFCLFDRMAGGGGPKSCFAGGGMVFRKFCVKVLDL